MNKCNYYIWINRGGGFYNDGLKIDSWTEIHEKYKKYLYYKLKSLLDSL